MRQKKKESKKKRLPIFAGKTGFSSPVLRPLNIVEAVTP